MLPQLFLNYKVRKYGDTLSTAQDSPYTLTVAIFNVCLFTAEVSGSLALEGLHVQGW